MMQFIIRLLISAVAIWVAVRVVPGISYAGHWSMLLAVALVFGALNASVRPILKILTFPLLILTLGLFTLVINALMLWLTGWISEVLGFGFQVDGFWPAFLGGLVVSIVSLALSLLVGEPERPARDGSQG
jgi:putative membrane protein